MLGLGLGVVETALRGGGFSPASLFAGGEGGALYDPSDITTLFQDDAGTVPVTAAGQPVGRLSDKSGNGNHASQATAASRPILRRDGNGKHYLEFDGADDVLYSTSADFAFTDDFSLWMGLRYTGDADFQPVSGKFTSGIQEGWDLSVQAGVPRITLRGSSNIDTFNGGFDSITGANQVLGVAASRTRIRRWVGLQGADTSGTWTPIVSPQPFALGARGNDSARYTGRLYGACIIDRALSDTERARLSQWMAINAGAAL